MLIITIHLEDLNYSFLICVGWAAAAHQPSQVTSAPNYSSERVMHGASHSCEHSGDVQYSVCCIHSLPCLIAPAVTRLRFLNRATGWYTCTYATGFKWMLLNIGYHWRGHLLSPITSFSSARSHSCLPCQLFRDCLKCMLTASISFKPPSHRILKSDRVFGITAQLIWTHAAERAVVLDWEYTRQPYPGRMLIRIWCALYRGVDAPHRTPETEMINLQPFLFDPVPLLLCMPLFHSILWSS